MSGKLEMEKAATRQQIDEAGKTEPDPHDKEWLMSIRMAHLGCMSPAEIALVLGHRKRAIRYSLKTYPIYNKNSCWKVTKETKA